MSLSRDKIRKSAASISYVTVNLKVMGAGFILAILAVSLRQEERYNSGFLLGGWVE